MPVLFDPKPGLVIRFDFLWKEEARAGSEQGRKDRPCAIILATKPKEDGVRDVVLCPITHSPPREGETAVEIPPKLARHLKLDDERSWIKTHQVNTVEWEKDRLPYGVVPAHPGQWVFGQLHHAIGKQAFEQVRENATRKRLRNVRREDDAFLKKEREKLQRIGTDKEKRKTRTRGDTERER